MATADRTLMLKLIADVNQPAKQMKGLGASLKKAGAAAKSWGKAFAGALVIGGIEKLVDSLGEAEKAFRDEQDVIRTLGQTWKNLGRDGDQLAGVLDRIGNNAVNLGFDDAEVLRAFNTFLAKTGSVKDSTQGVQAAMNLARAKGISFARAVKIVTGSLGDLGPELRRNKEQARRWARNHPLEVAVGKINDEWANFVGFFTQGKVNKAFAALGNIGTAINDLLFGAVGKGGKRTGGLIDRFVDIGRKLVPAIIAGLGGLGEQLGNALSTALATTDFAKLLGDTIANAVALIGGNSQLATNLGIAAVSIATGLFVASIFANALTTMLKAPELLFSAAVKTAMWALGAALGVTMRVAMWTGEKAIGLAEDGLRILLQSIIVTEKSVVGGAAFGLGRLLAIAIAGGVAFGLPALIASVLKDILDNILPGGTRLRWNPETGRMERFAQGGIVTRPTLGLLGEAGPEAVIPLNQVGALGGITINITTGIGDPVAIGREVDRVLRAWRSRSGTRA